MKIELHKQSTYPIDYRYGFNGKEMDNEIKGITGSSYDFGARIYDPRIGRWLSLDPLARKYPMMSPYNFVANSPIKFVDFDGKDYGVEVNHTAKTIIIKATLYTTKADAASATSAAMAWNDQNGKYQYKVGEGKNATYYDVKFQVRVDDTQSNPADAYLDDNSGEANLYQINSEFPKGTHGETQATPGKGGSYIQVGPKEQEERGSGGHELGHAFGLGHFWKGLLKGGENNKRQDHEQEITKGMVQKILNNSGIGETPTSQGTDRQRESAKAPGKSTMKKPTGKAPKGFKSGKLKRRRSKKAKF